MWNDDLNEIERPEDAPKRGLIGRAWDRLTRDDANRNMSLSSDWARKRTKNTDPEKVAHDLMEIRGAVHNLLKIHGLPLETQVELAMMGGMGAGAAGFLDFDTTGQFTRPVISLDKAIYEDCEADAITDVYCGIGLHEASHILHTREYFKRQKAQSIKGLRVLWEGLLEDERIEELAKQESPGFAPYLHATKRHLFEKQEFGNALSKWDEQPDRDKTLGIIFGSIRVPYLFEEKHQKFKTLKGVCVYDEMVKILDKMPETEADVADLGGKLEKFWRSLIEDEKDMAGKSDEQAAEDMMSNESGDPQQGGEGSGSKQGSGSNDGGGESGEGSEEGQGGGGDSEEESENSDEEGKDGEGDGEGDGEENSDKSDGAGGEDESKDDDGKGDGQGEDLPEPQTKEEAVQEVKERRERQAQADEQDNKQAETVRKLEQLAKELNAEGSKNAADVSANAQRHAEQMDENQAKLDKYNELKEELKERDGRFGLIDMKQMMDRMDSVSSPLDKQEALAVASAEQERLTFGQTWDPTKFDHGGKGPRKTLIVHPVKNDQATGHYNRAKNEVKGHIQKMKNVFKFRLGTKTFQQTELVEGRIHRKMLAMGQSTNRIFQRSYTRTEKGIAICLLLDNSGSMGGLGYGRGKADNALRTAVTIAEALKGVPGIELEVYSFTTCGSGNQDCFIKYLYGKNNPHVEGLGNYGIGRSGSNYDHAAILAATDLLIKNTENTNRMMIVMSDGQPAGAGYGGVTAMNLTKKAVHAAEKKGVYTMQVAIDSVASERMFKHFVTFTDMNDLINRMRKLVTRVVKRTSQS